MRKLIDLMAIASFVISASVVGGGVYIFTQKEAIINEAKERVTDAVGDIIGGSITGGITESLPELPELPGLPAPSSPAGPGLPMPF